VTDILMQRGATGAIRQAAANGAHDGTVPAAPPAYDGQPYHYVHRPLVEPDWTRLLAWRDVTAQEWASAQWQRAHCVK
jgi:lysine 2,3-aminomutase